MAESIGVVGVKKGLLRGFMTASIEGGQAVSINARNAACLVGFSPYYGSFISMFGYRSNSLSTIMSPSLSKPPAFSLSLQGRLMEMAPNQNPLRLLFKVR